MTRLNAGPAQYSFLYSGIEIHISEAPGPATTHAKLYIVATVFIRSAFESNPDGWVHSLLRGFADLNGLARFQTFR
jgi:hypothetical protein